VTSSRKEFSHHQINLNNNVFQDFSNEELDAVCLVEVIERFEKGTRFGS